MKTFIVFVVLTFFCSFGCLCDEYNDFINSELSGDRIKDIQNAIPENEYSEGFSFSDTAKNFISQKTNFNFNRIISIITDTIFGGLRKNKALLGEFLALILMCALTENISSAFKGTFDNTGFFACFLAVTSLGLKIFFEISEKAVALTDNLVVLMGSLIPVLLGFVAGSGNTATATALHPVFFVAGTVISMLIKNVVIPCLFLVLALKITDCVAGKSSLKRLFTILSNLIKWTVGILITVFLAIVGIFGTAVPAMDSIGVKTAKYAVGNFIPVVGGMLSDSLELVFTCSSVLKSGVGVAGLGAIAVTAVFPCLEIFSQIIIFNIATALSEPVCNEKISRVLADISSTLTMLFSMVIFIAIMYFISVATIMSVKGGYA